jgi:hypothetical protein
MQTPVYQQQQQQPGFFQPMQPGFIQPMQQQQQQPMPMPGRGEVEELRRVVGHLERRLDLVERLLAFQQQTNDALLMARRAMPPLPQPPNLRQHNMLFRGGGEGGGYVEPGADAGAGAGVDGGGGGGEGEAAGGEARWGGGEARWGGGEAAAAMRVAAV